MTKEKIKQIEKLLTKVELADGKKSDSYETILSVDDDSFINFDDIITC